MSNARFQVPHPVNEPVLPYTPGSPERAALQAVEKRMRNERLEIPLIIGGKEVRTGKTVKVTVPHDHGHVLAEAHLAGPKEVEAAAAAAKEAWKGWSEMAFEDRAAVFLKMADLLAGPWRQELNGATLLNQSKTCHQAEIDAACELIDFFRFNVHYAQHIYGEQPLVSPRGMWNRLEHRPLEGFVFAVTPFNFTSIAGNLPTAPAIMGNVCLWKPASSCLYSGWALMRLFQAAGLPDGVINFLPGSGREVGDPAVGHGDFAGLHFTGSTGVFQGMWQAIGANLPKYRSYPRIVGETGGKDFIFAHPSADADALVAAMIRGAFEYQGQKCSAASRAFVPKSLWPRVKERLLDELKGVAMGDPADFRNFMGAVIDKASFTRIKGYIDDARKNPDAEVIAGGECDDRKGWFIQPTVIEAKSPAIPSMCEEIFGPVFTVYAYDDARLDETLALCDTGSPYALTGAVFAQDRNAIVHMAGALRHSAGNFYINDKPTGAVVGQQPFGGGRASGTNDKAGSMLNLLRWVSPRTLKETFDPPKDWRYPFLA